MSGYDEKKRISRLDSFNSDEGMDIINEMDKALQFEHMKGSIFSSFQRGMTIREEKFSDKAVLLPDMNAKRNELEEARDTKKNRTMKK